MWTRRTFLKATGTAAAGILGSSALALPTTILSTPELTKLTILHTNDVHSRIDPFPMDGSERQGRGGAARRAALIKQIRSQEEHVLLLDAGDILQGTPYFNFFEGEPEIKLMSAMEYDAGTIGNHEFDAGIERLAELQQMASFPFVSSNYHFDNTPMQGRTLPYSIIEKGPLKIGLLGLNIEIRGLVPEKLTGDTQVSDALDAANKYAAILKNDYKCDYVVCLSHLGYKYEQSDKVSDIVIAENSRNIDLILGGHTHTFMDAPDIRKDLDGSAVYINQAGWAGMVLGRIDVTFEYNRKNRCIHCNNQPI